MKKIFWILFFVFCAYFGSLIILSKSKSSYNKVLISATTVQKPASFIIFNMVYFTLGFLIALFVNVLLIIETIKSLIS